MRFACRMATERIHTHTHTHTHTIWYSRLHNWFTPSTPWNVSRRHWHKLRNCATCLSPKQGKFKLKLVIANAHNTLLKTGRHVQFRKNSLKTTTFVTKSVRKYVILSGSRSPAQRPFAKHTFMHESLNKQVLRQRECLLST